MGSRKYKYDAFVSHAVEDKLPVANDLCLKLEQSGLRVWYSGKELKVGDSLERAVLKGLEESRFGIVILSPTYLEKNWTRKEFYLLMAKEIEQRKVILPILYNISNEDLRSLDIAIADRWAIPFEKGLDVVVQKLLEVIDSHSTEPVHTGTWIRKLFSWRVVAVSILCCLLPVAYFFYVKFIHKNAPSRQEVEAAIHQRIDDLESETNKEYKIAITEWNATPSGMDEVSKAFTNFSNFRSNYRNEYLFDNGFSIIRSKKNVEAALQVSSATLIPANSYGLASPDVHLSIEYKQNKVSEVHYLLLNKQSPGYSILTAEYSGNGMYKTSVSYTQNIRYLSVNLIYPSNENMPKRHQLMIKGLMPIENYTFENKAGKWALVEVE